jgi:hypothetical protein
LRVVRASRHSSLTFTGSPATNAVTAAINFIDVTFRAMAPQHHNHTQVSPMFRDINLSPMYRDETGPNATIATPTPRRCHENGRRRPTLVKRRRRMDSISLFTAVWLVGYTHSLSQVDEITTSISFGSSY